MDDANALRERIEGLETRVAFQEQTIDELSTTITDLWKQIEALSRKVALVGEQLKSVQATAGPAEPPEPPPPHY